MAAILQVIFNYIFVNQNLCIFIQMPPKFVARGAIDKYTPLV